MTIYLGDCREMPFTGAHSLVTDPPYRAHVHNSAVSQSRRRGVRARTLGFVHLSDALRDWTGAMTAKISRWSLIYSDAESLGDWRQSIIDGEGHYIRAIPWVRWSMPQLSGDRPTSGCEMLTLAWGHQRGKKSWNGPGNLTHFDHKCLRGSDKHKTEKPLDQALDLVSWFSNRGETVADFFSGAGTVGLACAILDREFVGAELDAEWHAKSCERIARYERDRKLSERDEERYQRWLEANQRRSEDMARIAAHTAKMRARLTAA